MRCFINRNQQIVQAKPMNQNAYREMRGSSPFRLDRAGWQIVAANGEVTWMTEGAFQLTHKEVTEAEKVLLKTEVFVAKGYHRALPGESSTVG